MVRMSRRDTEILSPRPLPQRHDGGPCQQSIVLITPRQSKVCPWLYTGAEVRGTTRSKVTYAMSQSRVLRFTSFLFHPRGRGRIKRRDESSPMGPLGLFLDVVVKGGVIDRRKRHLGINDTLWLALKSAMKTVILFRGYAWSAEELWAILWCFSMVVIFFYWKIITVNMANDKLC